MANLCFPQLSSGALVQYPIRKTRSFCTTKNVLADGTVISFWDSPGDRLTWQLEYTNLSSIDIANLQSFVSACAGPFRSFTFIDPTDNMLNSSSDLTSGAWQKPNSVSAITGVSDPQGGSSAFTLTNTGGASQEILQTLAVPSGYQYCFSVYASSSQPSTLTVIRRGASTQDTSVLPVGIGWTRLVSSGSLNDSGYTFTVSISLLAGQQISVFGAQLEAQIQPSSYLSTANAGGVYGNAHLINQELTVVATGPDAFSTAIAVETAI